MKRRLIALGIVLAMVFMLVLSGCTENEQPPVQEKRPEVIEKIGKVPDEFRSIIENNKFYNAYAFDDRLLSSEVCLTDSDTHTVVRRVWMMDTNGKELASYTCSSDDAYCVSTLTATEDGGFLFVLGFFDYHRETGWASDNGVASRVIKLDKNGNVQFDTPLEDICGRSLEFCIEKNGLFYLFGTIETPETKIQGVGSPSDIYMAILDKNGALIKTKCIVGSDFDNLFYAEMVNDEFVLSIYAQSNDGDFTGSGANRGAVFLKYVVNDELEIIEKKQERGRDPFDRVVGIKDDGPIYSSDAMFENYDSGNVTAFIEYGDRYLIVSENQTGICDKRPLYINSSWYYTETVYSLYDNGGNIVFRASIDSSPDYDAILQKLEQNK